MRTTVTAQSGNQTSQAPIGNERSFPITDLVLPPDFLDKVMTNDQFEEMCKSSFTCEQAVYDNLSTQDRQIHSGKHIVIIGDTILGSEESFADAQQLGYSKSKSTKFFIGYVQ